MNCKTHGEVMPVLVNVHEVQENGFIPEPTVQRFCPKCMAEDRKKQFEKEERQKFINSFKIEEELTLESKIKKFFEQKDRGGTFSEVAENQSLAAEIILELIKNLENKK
jgi:hypothetical protein